MIASVTGEVLAVDATSVVVASGGVGLRVLVAPDAAAMAQIGSEVSLHTTLVVREDSLTLYGFSSAPERAAFEMLLTASGVGPRTALAAMSVLTPVDLVNAVRSGDLVALTRVPGIGHKGAQKIVIELKDKVLSLEVSDSTGAATSTGEIQAWRDQVIGGLQGLGWNLKDAESAADKVAPLAADHSIGELMRAALQTLARH